MAQLEAEKKHLEAKMAVLEVALSPIPRNIVIGYRLQFPSKQGQSPDVRQAA
jgi:hypothetical protein